MILRMMSLLVALLSLGQAAIVRYESEMNLGGYLFLVNRARPISADYVPPDLVRPDVKSTSDAVLMRHDAARALEKMFLAAKEEENYTLIAVSGYRSYATQSSIFSRKVSNVGRKNALLYVAPPGCSEHQLGLAMDLGARRNTSLEASFGDTDEGKWVAQNCWRFGFILRYRDEWTPVTGYAYEPWHVRYVGEEHAARIFEADIPFETYIAQIREAMFAYLVQGGER